MSVVNPVESAVPGLMIAQGTTTVGRSQSNKLVVPEETVSLYHAKIVTFDKVAYIQDLDSTNGTFVNGKKVQQHALHIGDHVVLGKYAFTIAGFE